MRKTKVTALTSGKSPAAVRVNHKERAPISDERFKMILDCVMKVAGITEVTILELNAGFWKVIAAFYEELKEGANMRERYISEIIRIIQQIEDTDVLAKICTVARTHLLILLEKEESDE